MSFCLGKELQNAGMKGAGLMGEMITCHCYKNGWNSAEGLRVNWRKMGGGFLWGYFHGLSFFSFGNEVLAEQSNGLPVTGAGSPWVS